MSKIRVLVVDDSALMRKIITDILTSSHEIEVIGKAKDGKDAIEKVTRLKPDVVTMDIEMPELNGLEALGYIMSEYPTRVIMLSSANSRQADNTIKAFQYGAIDFISKPSGNISLDLFRIKYELIEKVMAAAKVDVNKLGFLEEQLKEKTEKVEAKKTPTGKIVVIGASTGGPRALQQVIPLLPKNFNVSVLVVQHMPGGFTRSMAERLNSMSSIEVREARNGDIVEPGRVLIAPGDFHMTVKRQIVNGETKEVIALTKDKKVKGVRPSFDVLLNSIAPIFESNAVGVILTGMGTDGYEGIQKLKQAGGKVIAEDESTCVVYGMPRAVIEQKLADLVLPITRIAQGIVQIE